MCLCIFSAFEGSTNDLELGDEVEYTLTRKSSKLSAENIKKLSLGTVPINEVKLQELCCYYFHLVKVTRFHLGINIVSNLKK